MPRIAVGQILQETNSINPVPTVREDFSVYGIAAGAAVMDRYGDVGELAGFAQLPGMPASKIEWVGLVRAVAWSGGPMTDMLLAELTAELVSPAADADVDGVLLSLHGSQCSTSCPDAAGHLIAAVRFAVGPDVPIVATLDLHANITARMAANADVLVGYHTHPHTDHVQTGARAAAALAWMLETGRRPQVSAYRIPMIANDDGRATDTGVLSDLWRRIVAAEAADDVLSIGLYQVQPWLDVPNVGWTLYQAWCGDAPPLEPVAVAAACWATRDYAEREYLRPEAVIPAAMAIPGRPVVVSESHDATNSGAPGDSTHLLKALLDADIPDGGALTFCVDPAAVAASARAGIGRKVTVTVGGKRDSVYCAPLRVQGVVERLGPLEYVLSGHGGDNLRVNMGNAAVIRSRDVTLLLTEHTGPGSSPLMYRAMGLEPTQFKIVVAKSPEGFRRDYESFAAGILYCTAPGCSNPILTELGYTNVTRPVHPVSEMEDISEASWAGPMELKR